MANNGKTWPEEHDESLKKFLTEGLTFSEVANAMNTRFPGCGYSRNACIGRARRQEISSSKSAQKAAIVIGAKHSAEKRRKPKRTTDVSYNAKTILKRREEPKFIADDVTGFREADVVPLKIELNDLTTKTCHWPIGGWPSSDPITFCGHPPHEEGSYCYAHFRLSLRRTGVERPDSSRNLLKANYPASRIVQIIADTEEAGA